MKGILVLLALSTALLVDANSFQHGHEYSYDYIGRVVSGLPGIEKRWSGMAIKSLVTIQAHQKHLIIKMNDILVERLNEQVQHFRYRDTDFKPQLEYNKKLTEPFKVLYEDNLVKGLYVDPEEPEWSVNVKKGIVSVLNIDLEQKNLVPYTKTGQTIRSDPRSNFFKVLEDSITGKCETSYTFKGVPFTSNRTRNKFVVIKATNFENCQERPLYEYSNIKSENCGCEASKNPLRNYESVYYVLRGERSQFQIKKIFTKNKYVFNPDVEGDQPIISSASQMLRLKNIKTTEEEILISYEPKKLNNYRYTMPERIHFNDMVDLKKAHHTYARFDHMAQVSEVVRALLEMVKDYKSINVTNLHQRNLTSRYVEVVKQMTSLDYNGIHEVYQLFVNRGGQSLLQQDKHREALYWNVLIEVGTNPAITYGIHLIKTSEKSRFQVSLLTKIPNVVREPTELLLDQIYGLCSHPNVVKDELLQRSCYLATAEYLGKYCKTNGPDIAKRDVCRDDTKRKYYQILSKKLNESETLQNQTTFIFALGKTKAVEALTLFKPIVQGGLNYTLHPRIQAIWSLSSFIQTYPEQVMEITIPVIFNQTEDYELRIAAFTITMAADPPLALFYSLAKLLRNMPDQHVKNYVYTTFVYMANSTYPCYNAAAQKASIALETLKSTSFNATYSPKYSWKMVVEDLKDDKTLAGITSMTFVGNNVSYIPRSIYVNRKEMVFGRPLNVMEFSIRTEGLERLVDKIFGPEGMLYSSGSSSPSGLKSRTVNTAAKALKEIENLLAITPREYEPLIAQVYSNLIGQPMVLFFNETTVNNTIDIIKATYRPTIAALELGLNIHSQMYNMILDHTTELPTPVGLPVILDIKLTQLSSFNLPKLSVHGLNTLHYEERRTQTPNITAYFNGVLATDFHYVVTMAAVSPFDSLKHGAGYEQRRIFGLALNGSVGYDFSINKMFFSTTPIAQQLMHVHFEPFTFIDSYSNVASLANEKTYTPIGIHKFNTTYGAEVGHEYLGMGLSLNSTYHGFNYGKYFMYKLFKSTLMYPSTISSFHPFNYNISLTNTTLDATNNITSSLRFNFHDIANQNEFIPQYVDKDQDFDAYIAGKENRKPSTFSVVGHLELHGNKVRKIDGELVYQQSKDELFHRIALKMKRSPFYGQEANSEYCLSAKLRKPEIDWMQVHNLQLNALNLQVKADVGLQWGRNCQSDKKIKVSLKFDRTEEQISLFNDIAKYKAHYAALSYPYHAAFPHPSNLGFNLYADQYYRCIALQQQGHAMNSDCEWLVYTVLQLRKVSGAVQYNNIPEYFSNFTMKSWGAINNGIYNHVEFYFTDKFSRLANTINFQANMSVYKPIFDAQVMLPVGNIFYHRVNREVFRPISAYYPHSFAMRYSEHYFTNYKNWRQSSCVFDNWITTFNNRTYKAPMTGCYHILAKDCSPNSTFTVLGSNSTDKVYSKKMKIILYKDVIDFIPVSGVIRVRLDGRNLKISDELPHFQYKQVGITRKILYTITLMKGVYLIEAPEIGLYVAYSGNVGFVVISNYYRGKQCGLCGNMNGNTDYSELTGPKQCQFTNTTAFTYSYAVPTSDCKVPAFNQSRLCQKSLHSECTVLRNHQLLVGTAKNQKICFSTQALPECKQGCKAETNAQKDVKFHCLNAGDSYTKKLVRERETRVFTELENKSADITRAIQYPSTCSK